MKMELTQRDKGLIIFLGVIVTIFIFGYFFIYPISQTIKETEAEIETQEDLKEVNDYKLMNLVFVQDDNKMLEEKMAVVRKNFYPIMESDQVDKYFTEMALDYNLYVYSLKIRQAEDEVDSEAYQYSVKYEEDKLHEEEAQSESGSKDEDEASDEGDAADADSEFNPEAMFEGEFEDDPATGIYVCSVDMRLGGDVYDMQRLIDDLSKDKKNHLINKYSWSQGSNMVRKEDGSVEMDSHDFLDITVDMYQCKE